jgi:hypothetical protein
VVGRLIVSTLLACTLGATVDPVPRVQEARGPYDALSAAQRALLPGAVTRARDDYNRAPASFRQAFEVITTRLSSLLLWDPENGEVLGSGLELIEQVEMPAAPPPPESGVMRLSVTLASGARDRLRRSREFALDDATGAVAFVHGDPPPVRIELTGPASHAVVAVIRR